MTPSSTRSTPACLILAAGRSSRMAPLSAAAGVCGKPLLPLGDSTMLGMAVRTCRDAGLADIRVIVGHGADEVSAAALDLGARPVRNPDHARGMFGSIRCGLADLLHVSTPGSSPAGVFILPVDAALVAPASLKALNDNFTSAQDILIPEYHGLSGHPPLLGLAHAQEIIAWPEPEQSPGGLRAWLDSKRHAVRRLSLPDPGILSDLDRPEDYAAAWRQLPPTLFIMRHASAAPPGVLTGRSDPPLLPQGESEALAMRARLSPIPFSQVWTSPLIRARRTAEIVCPYLTPTPVPALAEISLGDWDGKHKTWVQANYPQEWERRGQDMANYPPPGGQSPAALARQILPALQALITQAATRPATLIVAHRTVNAILLACLDDSPLPDALRAVHPPAACWARKI